MRRWLPRSSVSRRGQRSGVSVDGKREPEARALAWRRLQAHPPALELDQLARDRQTKAGAAVACGDLVAGLPKLLKDPFMSRRLDTDAGVEHGDLGHRARRLAEYRHRAGRRELDRVRHEVGQNLANANGVADDSACVGR